MFALKKRLCRPVTFLVLFLFYSICYVCINQWRSRQPSDPEHRSQFSRVNVRPGRFQLALNNALLEALQSNRAGNKDVVKGILKHTRLRGESDTDGHPESGGGKRGLLDMMSSDVELPISSCFPQFLVIGSQKSGTTSLNAWLKTLEMLARKTFDNEKKESTKSGSDKGVERDFKFVNVPKYAKELNMFSERLPYFLGWQSDTVKRNGRMVYDDPDHPGQWWIPKGSSSLDDMFSWYRNQWESEPPSNGSNGVALCSNETSVRGEVSPNYLSSPFAPFLTRYFLPDTKIIVILRDPVERLISAFNMKWQIRTCLPGDAWKREDCFQELLTQNVTTIESMIDNWLQELEKSTSDEMKDIQDCMASTFSQDEIQSDDLQLPDDMSILYDRIRCAYPRSIFEKDNLNFQNAYDSYTTLEDFSFLKRSLYYRQLLLWNHFFPIEPSRYLFISAAEFEQEPIQTLLNKIGPFIGVNFESYIDILPPSSEMTRHKRKYVVDLPHSSSDVLSDHQRRIYGKLCKFFLNENTNLFAMLSRHDFKKSAKRLKQSFRYCRDFL